MVVYDRLDFVDLMLGLRVKKREESWSRLE